MKQCVYKLLAYAQPPRECTPSSHQLLQSGAHPVNTAYESSDLCGKFILHIPCTKGNDRHDCGIATSARFTRLTKSPQKRTTA